jgi:hypothetical protein
MANDYAETSSTRLRIGKVEWDFRSMEKQNLLHGQEFCYLLRQQRTKDVQRRVRKERIVSQERAFPSRVSTVGRPYMRDTARLGPLP